MNEKPNYVLKFNEGFMQPVHDDIFTSIVKIASLVVILILGICIFLFKDELSIKALLILIVVGIFLLLLVKSLSKYERVKSPCELRFYDDYLVHYCEKRRYSRKTIRKEYYKFKYSDITRCVHRTVVNKICIYGIVDATFFKYDKTGKVDSTPYKHRVVDSMTMFYMVFEPDIDIVKEIEDHSPIKVKIEAS